ncbi:ABC transporter ATP-binding protein [Microbacterium sp.]|uniref:ABC transporter ATP-binding protein n=1 Tax=Microbacterium sp. TaxID=51671 RepID=UPI0039E4597F
MTAPVIELRDAAKTYPGPPPVAVLAPTSLRVHAGERVAVVGPSGSGKSTLLAILGTLDVPTSGIVLVDGADAAALTERRRAALRARRIGFVFQQFHLLPALTAWENVATGLLYAGVPAAERRRRASDALADVGLAARRHHRPGALSGGEQQRVAIARALVRDPGILFADEPTGSLDSATGSEVVALLAAAADRGTAVVVVTHDEGVAAHFPRRIGLRDGVVTSDPAGPERRVP